MINTFKYKTIQIFHKYSLPRWFVLIIDTFSVFVAFFFAYMLRYNLERYSFNEDLAIQHALFVSGVYFLFMLFFKSYSGLIRQTTIKDIFIIVITNTVAFSILVLISLLSIMFHLSGLLDLQLSILFIHYGVARFCCFFSESSSKCFMYLYQCLRATGKMF